jgi:hypothetical protein
VITATDAGGPLDVVRDRETGLVVAPTIDELARACEGLREPGTWIRVLPGTPAGAQRPPSGVLRAVESPQAASTAAPEGA